MIQDILNVPTEVQIGENVYRMEFNNMAYGILENSLDMGIFKLFQKFVVENNLKSEEAVEVVCAGLLKHHSKNEIAEAKQCIRESAGELMGIMYLIQVAFAKPLMLPSLQKNAVKKKTRKVK